MAVNTNQSYAETLREMRVTRMQQLRQGSTQAQIMGRQTSVLSSMSNSMSKQLQMTSRLESSQRSSNQQLVNVNRNLTSLSAALTRSVSGFASAVAKSTGGGGGGGSGSAAGMITNTASAAASIATSIATGISRVLPMAIAGYVIKAVSWDHMSEQTKEKISGSMGRLFSKAFEEIDSTELGHMMTKALTPAFQQAKKLYNRAGEKIDAVRDRSSSGDGSEDDSTMSETEKKIRKARIIAKARAQTGEDIYDTFSDIRENLPEVGGVPTKRVVEAVGTTGIVVGGAKVLVPDIFTSKKPASKATQAAMETMKKYGLKGKDGLLASRMLNKAASLGSVGLRFLDAFKKYKMAASGAFVILGGIIHFMDYKYLKDEIKAMADEGIFNQEEVDYLVGRLKAEQWGEFFGSAVGGTTGAIAGSSLGPVGTVGVGMAGSYVGSEFMGSAAVAAYDVIHEKPESLKADITEESFPSTKKLIKKGYGLQDAKPDGKPNAGASSNQISNLDDVPVEQYMDEYREKVGGGEGGSAKYDAVYGAGTPEGVEKYMKNETHGKKLTEMTIDEAIAFQKKRKGNTHAMGRYQFMNIKGAAALAGLKGSDLMSPKNQDKMFAAYTKENAKRLKELKLPVNPFTLRLAHAIGYGNVRKMLEANPNAVPATVLGYKEGTAEYKTNPQLWKNGVTVSSYLARIKDSVAGVGGGSYDSSGDTQMAEASAAEPEETPEQKRRKKLTNLFESTKAAFDPEKLKSDLLESLEIAKTVMMGEGGSGGTTVINNDNSVNSSAGGGASQVAGGGKSPIPVIARNNLEHETLV